MDKYLIIVIILHTTACNNNDTINIAVASNFEKTLEKTIKPEIYAIVKLALWIPKSKKIMAAFMI